jgi:acetyl esterase/lipase
VDTRQATLTIKRHGTTSVRARILAAGVRRVLAPRLAKVTFSERELRRAAALDRLAARARPPKGATVEPVRFDGFGAEWVHGPGVGKDRTKEAIIYFHGGGWICCGLNTHRPLVARISAAAGVPVLSVDYRMMPAVTFEAEVDDCLTAYRWLLDQGLEADRVVAAGDSAGGYMAFAMTLRAREDDIPLPAGIVALSPMLDMDLAGKSAHANAALDPSAPIPLLERFNEVFLADADLTDPRISPIQADLTGLPPALLSVGSTEVLFHDSELMAHRLVAAGVPAVLQIWDGQLHVFQAYSPLVPEAKTAIAEIGAYIRGRLDRQPEYS